MNKFYTYKPGIQLCEQPTNTLTLDFISFTIFCASTPELWSVLKEMSEYLVTDWPVILKWRTVGYSLEDQKIQEIFLRKDIEKTLKANGLLRKNERSKIYSYISAEKTKSFDFSPKELTQHRNTFLLLRKTEADLLELWSSPSKIDKGVTSQGIYNFLTKNRETIIVRFIESGTHSSTQLIGPAEQSEKIMFTLNKIIAINVNKDTFAKL